MAFEAGIPITSNYRELCNLAEALEEAVEEAVIDGSVQGSELFIFTYNSVAEGCFYRGTVSSRKLFNLVTWLRPWHSGHYFRA